MQLVLIRQSVAVLENLRRPRGIPVPLHQRNIPLRCDQFLDHTDELYLIHAILGKHSRCNAGLFFYESHKDVLTSDIALMQIPCSLGSLLQRCLCLIRKLLHFSMPLQKLYMDTLIAMGEDINQHKDDLNRNRNKKKQNGITQTLNQYSTCGTLRS